MKRTSVSEGKNGLSGLLSAEIVRQGVAVPPRTPLDVERFLGAPVARLTEGATASEIIVAERAARD